MSLDPDPKGVDRDGLFTFLLTIPVVVLGLGLPLLITYLHALRIAMASHCHGRHGACLLVFGKRLVHGAVDRDYRLRLNKTHELIQQNPHRRVILLGGAPRTACLSEAMAGLNYLKEKGVEHADSIQLEEGSRNTLENLRHARNMLEAAGANTALLITNRYHLARSRMIAKSLGIEHTLCPAEASIQLTPSMMGKLLFESYYILWFSVGKIWARLTDNQRMLKRVT